MKRSGTASQRLWAEAFGPSVPELDEAKVLAIVDRLPQHQGLTVRLRFGFGGRRPLSLEQLARRLPRLNSSKVGVSRETARLELKTALRRLRSHGLSRAWQEAGKKDGH